ncbi:MAG: helix-turn-helix transcriptional regulator [Lentisphaeria bacterium]|nr:helix-turn-helix transcriptional regulator [Lentisphaeria bacterium]
MEEAGNNPYQRRHDTKTKVDQEVYVDRDIRVSASSGRLHAYACARVQSYPGGWTKNFPRTAGNSAFSFYWTMIFISEGKGSFRSLTDNARTPIRRGDLVITRPQAAYTVLADKGCKLVQKQLMLVSSPIVEWMCGKGGVQPWKVCRGMDAEKLEEIYDEIFRLASGKKENPRTEISILSYALLCEIDKAEEGSKRLDKFEQILFAIRQAPQFYRTVEVLAREFAISKRTLFYLFKTRMNISPVKYIIAERLEKSRWYLLNRSYTVTAAAELCGYNSAAYFSREFRRAYGFSPQEYRQNYFRTGRDLLSKKREEGLPVSGGRGTRTDPPPSPRR